MRTNHERKTTHNAAIPPLRVDEKVSLEEQIALRINAALLTATLGVAILENVLADRDPQLASLYVLVMASMVFLGGGRFSLDARLFSQQQQTTAAFQKRVASA